jgi:hypothetical protein
LNHRTSSSKHLILAITLLLVTSLGLVTPVPAAAAPPFTLTVQPTRQTISPGMSASYSITVTSSGGFNSPVVLNLANAASLPTSISMPSFFPSNVATPPAGGSGFAIIIIQTTDLTPVDDYQLMISGTGGGFTESATVVLSVTNVSTFHVYASPASQIVGLGYSNQFQIVVASLDDFSSNVALSLVTPPFGISYTITPSTVTPPTGATATATLGVSVATDLTPGDYALIIEASLPDCIAGNCVDYTFVVVQVPSVTEFQIAVSPTAQSVVINQDVSLDVQAMSVGGFSSNVQLDLQRVPSGVDFSFNPTTLSPSPTENSPATSILTISPSSNALAGSYNVDVVATSQGVMEISTITLTIVPITTQLTLTVPDTAVKRGDTFTVVGSISPVIPGAAVNVVYTRPDGSEFTRTVQTASDGTFSDQYTPETVDLVGAWKVRAEYIGGGAYIGSTTQSYDFQVVSKTFLETYGLLWLADYALWIVLLFIVAVLIVAAAFMALRRRAHGEKKGGPSPGAVVATTQSPPVWQSRPPAPTPAATKVCYNCGRVIAALARFCDRCDAPQLV